MNDSDNIVDVPKAIKNEIISLKDAYYSKGSIVRAITKESGSKENAKKFVNIVLNERKAYYNNNPDILKDKGRKEIKEGFATLGIGLSLGIFIKFALGIAIAGIIYIVFGLYKMYQARK